MNKEKFLESLNGIIKTEKKSLDLDKYYIRYWLDENDMEKAEVKMQDAVIHESRLFQFERIKLLIEEGEFDG